MTDSHAGHSGQVLSDGEWLDVHFRAMEPEYVAMVSAAGIVPGWRVLDAGCGTGPFVPLLRQLVGDRGWVDALDASPVHVATVRRRAELEGWTRISVLEGDLRTGVPATPAYDAIWCANVTQYLGDADLRDVVSGWRRIVHPGGLLAIKEFDVSGLRLDPLPPGLIDRWHSARCASGDEHALALDRTPRLGSFLAEAGWVEVRSRVFRMIRVPPLRPVERSLVRELLRFLASRASTLDVTDADRDVWQGLLQEGAPDRLMEVPGFRYEALQGLFVGRNP